METELFDKGLTLMLAGMGTVFAFLTTLVVVMTLMSKTLIRFQRELPGEDSTDEEIAAISAAIFKHRNN
jgi:oxaloacetate decarboxylase gamma subunit